MPIDEVGALKEVILRAIEARVQSLNNALGIGMPGGDPPAANAFSQMASAEVTAASFGTGYDSVLLKTTVPFTVDVSILTGGTSGDVLTG